MKSLEDDFVEAMLDSAADLWYYRSFIILQSWTCQKRHENVEKMDKSAKENNWISIK